MYSEQQGLPTALVVAIGLFLVVICAAPLVYLVVEHKLRVANFSLLLVPGLIVGFIAWFRLTTNVTADQLVVRAAPFGKAQIDRNQISKVETITYDPIGDFGGWGVRYGLGGKIYNARGDRAVKLTMNSGDIVYVGTQHPEELAGALARH